ncbi:MAG: hypothetical protein IPP15_14275 [Saprospiraceae bacterium]|uniref:Uncharacterized protein n=1 Tax=Candidatus Opimibacter skivensis TaxID=2982028 RepID=A0A9D7XPV0_9BACT|nr:hypothetical protein [Candidatus Opimibacter skivensis]
MKAIANFFSIVFHPLLILTYMTLVLLWTNPFSFGYRHVAEADTLLIIVVMTTITLPGIAVLMMKMLGWIDTFRMETRQERIGPYIVAGILYLTLYLHVSKADFPTSIRVATLGVLIGLWACFLINNFMKVSAHAAGMGGLVALVALTKLKFGYDEAQIGFPGGVNLIVSIDYLLYGVIILAGIVCTSRLLLKAHESKEVYLGLMMGILGMVISYLILH